MDTAALLSVLAAAHASDTSSITYAVAHAEVSSEEVVGGGLLTLFEANSTNTLRPIISQQLNVQRRERKLGAALILAEHSTAHSGSRRSSRVADLCHVIQRVLETKCERRRHATDLRLAAWIAAALRHKRKRKLQGNVVRALQATCTR